MDQTVVKETISVITKNVTEVDKALGAEFNRIGFMALNQAERYLLGFHGEGARLSITNTFLKTMARLSAADASKEIEEHRATFLGYLTSQHADINPHIPEAIDVGSASVTGPTDDQDQ